MADCKKCGNENDSNACDKCEDKSVNSTVNDAVNAAKEKMENVLNTKDSTGDYSKEEVAKNKIFCALAYIPILFWLPLVVGTKDSKYCKFHANQGLLLLILGIVIAVVGIVLGLIPVVGKIIGILTSLIELGYFLFGLINTIMGKSKELPLIGTIKILK